jgi:hypothetical protein
VDVGKGEGRSEFSKTLGTRGSVTSGEREIRGKIKSKNKRAKSKLRTSGRGGIDRERMRSNKGRSNKGSTDWRVVEVLLREERKWTRWNENRSLFSHADLLTGLRALSSPRPSRLFNVTFYLFIILESPPIKIIKISPKVPVTLLPTYLIH